MDEHEPQSQDESDAGSPPVAAGAPGIRFWPAGLVLAGGVFVLSYIWLIKDVPRQSKNLESLVVILAIGAMLLLWVLLLSRLRWKSRFLAVGGVAGLIGLLAACFEITGVSGDLVPVLAWRWRAEETLPDLSPTTATADGANTGTVTSEHTDVPSFPQFRGPDRNSILNGPALDHDWIANPPKELWRRKVGGGWAGFATFAHYAITLEQRGPQEFIACYHLLTGEPIWSHSYDASYESKVAGDGPRTVPTIVDNRVFAIGSTGVLNCLELTTGNVLWTKNVLDDHERSIPEWGYSASTLVHENKVIVNPGGHETCLVAYDATSGDQLWAGGSEGSHQSSPVLAEFSGVEQILLFSRPRIVSHSVEDGSVLWEYEWFEPSHPNVTMPVVLPNDQVLASAGYGEGSDVFQVSHDESTGWSTETIWRSNRLKSKFGAVVAVDGYAYGLDDGVFACIDIADGKRKWKKGRYGHGQMVLIGNTFLMLTEKGDIVLIEPNSESHKELARFSALNSKTWNPPAVAGDYLIVRNDKEAACYQLPTVQAN